MAKYQIESKAGLIFGVYEGETHEEAFAHMVEDAGTSGGAEGSPNDWIIFEVDN